MTLSSICYRSSLLRLISTLVPVVVLSISAGCQTIEVDSQEVHEITTKADGSFLETRLKNLEEQLEEYPKRDDLRYKIAGIHFSEEKYNDAVKHLEMAIELNPENPRYHYHLGRCYLKINEVDLAESSFREASRLMPNGRYSGVHFALGLAKFRKKDFVGAAAEFEAAVKAQPEGLEPYYFLACTNDALGKQEPAIKYFREYLDRGGRTFQSNAIFFLEKNGVIVDRQALEEKLENKNKGRETGERPGADPFEAKKG